MPGQIDELISKIKTVVPEDAVFEAKGDKDATATFNMSLGNRGLPVTLSIKPKLISARGQQTYPFVVNESECLVFNDRMRSEGIQAYANGNRFSVSYRKLINNADEAASAAGEFIQIAEKTLPEYESKCVNFLINAGENQEKEHDTAASTHEVSEAEERDKEEEYRQKFLKLQKMFSESCFEKSSMKIEGSRTIVSDTDKEKTYRIGKGDGRYVTLSLDKESGMVEACFNTPDDEERGIMAMSILSDEYPDIFTDYADGFLHMSAYISPDPEIPDEITDTVSKCVEAYETAKKSVGEKKGTHDHIKIVSDMKEILDAQATELEKRTAFLNEKEAELKELEERLAAQEEELVAASKEMEEQKAQMEASFETREKDLSEKEETFKTRLEEFEKDKAQYETNYSSLANRIAVLKAQGSKESGSGVSSAEYRKLKAQVDSLTRARASAEANYAREIEDARKRNQALMDELKKKDTAISEMENNLTSQASQIFQEEKAAYLKEIDDLKKRANISENEINMDSFANYLREKTDYTDVSIKHGKNNDIIGFCGQKGLKINLVFSDPMFVDVIKNSRAREKTMLQLNNETGNVKFFITEEGTVARRYIGRSMTNSDLVAVIADLEDYFT